MSKLNHDRDREIEWPDFLRRTLELLTVREAEHYIKDDLWKFADAGIRARFRKARLGGARA